jgi:hypothetical protein
LEICESRASSREIASFNCRATAGALRGASPRGASWRGAGFEICSIWRVIESSRWWMSSTARASCAKWPCGCGA